MEEHKIVFSDSDKLGKIASVDTSRVFIDVENHVLLTRVSVGDLVAVIGTTSHEYLIGITERVTRQVQEKAMLEEEGTDGTIPVGESNVDTIRAIMIGTYKVKEGEKNNIFKRGTETFPQIDRDCYLIESGNLQNLMNIMSNDLPENKRLELGKYANDNTAIAVADGDRFFQRHASILGSTGSGKSWAVALILERAQSLTNPNIIVLDMHGEYKPLSDKDEGYAKGYRIAGPGDLDKPDNNVIFLPYWLLNREEMLSMLLDRNDTNAPNQASRFTYHVRALKETTLKEGAHNKTLETFTVDSPIPYALNELVESLKLDDTAKKTGASGKDVKGDWEGKLTRFISRFTAKTEDRRYGFLFQPPSDSLIYGWLSDLMIDLLGTGKKKGIKIIDFSEVPSDVLPVIVGVFTRLIFDVQFWLEETKRTPIAIVCDEAHLYLPVKEDANVVEKKALESFERIAKEGRKYGVSLLVVSQRPSDVSRTILSQCNNFLALRLSNDQDQSVVKRLMPDSMAGLTDILPLLDVGEGLLLGDAVLLPTRIKLNQPKIKPISATRMFWKEWNEMSSSNEAIRSAVETLRRQTKC